MAEANCADLFNSEMNSYYKKIEDLEKKLIKFKDKELFVVSYCVLFYAEENNEIEEIRNLLTIEPSSKEEARILAKKVNKLKDLPNTEIKSYKKAIKEEISFEESNIARLNKSF